jgi:hypothetical protein
LEVPRRAPVPPPAAVSRVRKTASTGPTSRPEAPSVNRKPPTKMASIAPESGSRKAGADRGTADGHGVGITCSNTDGALRIVKEVPPQETHNWKMALRAW